MGGAIHGDVSVKGILRGALGGTLTDGQACAACSLSRLVSSAIRAAGSPDDPLSAFAGSFLNDVLQASGLGAGSVAPRTPAPVLAFDDEGFLMPGVVDASLPPTEQYQQLLAVLQRQGVPMSSAQSLAANALVAAGADARTVQGYFIPDPEHDAALKEALALRSTGASSAQHPSAPEIEPLPARLDENGRVIQLPPIVITGQRISLQDELAERVGGTLGQLYQEGKALATQGLQLAAEGLSLLDVPALQDFQQRMRDYLNARAEQGGLSEVETIIFGGLYALNETLMPTNALDFAGSAGKGITAAAAVIRAGRGADEIAQVVRAESQVVAAAAEARVAEVSSRAQAEGLELISARNGSRGDWNAALNGQLKPNATYLLDNGHAYVTDSAGRVVRADGVLDVSRADRNTWQQAATGHVGGDGYDGGHLIASLFAGAGERINLIPQLAHVNRGEFRVMEQQWAQAVLDRKTVRVEVSPVYSEGSSVPTDLVAKWWIDGVESVKRFPNTTGG